MAISLTVHSREDVAMSEVAAKTVLGHRRREPTVRYGQLMQVGTVESWGVGKHARDKVQRDINYHRPKIQSALDERVRDAYSERFVLVLGPARGSDVIGVDRGSQVAHTAIEKRSGPRRCANLRRDIGARV